MNKATKTKFPFIFWLVIFFEFIERGSYYGVMSVLSVYFTEILNFSKQDVGIIKSTIQPILYFLPIVAGALADKYGYRKTLMVAFTFLGIGYLLTSQVTSYALVFIFLCVMALGAGTFKPIISGTIAKVTDETNSSLGFGIFYWSINLGAFIVPLVIVPILKSISWNYILIFAGVSTGLMIIPTILFYKDVETKQQTTEKKDLLKTIANAFEITYSPVILLYHLYRKSNTYQYIITIFLGLFLGYSLYLYFRLSVYVLFYIVFLIILSFVRLIFKGYENQNSSAKLYAMIFYALGFIVILSFAPTIYAKILSSVIYLTVLSLNLIEINDKEKFVDHAKFLSLIGIYSGFWVLYFQMFDSVLWYVRDYVDAAQLNNFVNGIIASVGLNLQWQFDIEHVTVINAFTIILLQLIISKIVANFKALPTMMAGIMLGTIGMFLLSLSASIWVFMLGIFIFSIGEMTAHPKFISYIGQIAPVERKAMYMGYIFLYGVIGSSIGGVLGANLYVIFVDQMKQPNILWLIFSSIGLITVIGLYLFNKFVKFKIASK
ncbi:MAG TPA: MFS transporter [Ignavibacteriales bacterium]|nr:MFS transporter [Ignavibacteriales bacterium]HPP33828.1 MFS transporter [Ignavibacteriales bacterium]